MLKVLSKLSMMFSSGKYLLLNRLCVQRHTLSPVVVEITHFTTTARVRCAGVPLSYETFRRTIFIGYDVWSFFFQMIDNV